MSKPDRGEWEGEARLAPANSRVRVLEGGCALRDGHRAELSLLRPGQLVCSMNCGHCTLTWLVIFIFEPRWPVGNWLYAVLETCLLSACHRPVLVLVLPSGPALKNCNSCAMFW